MGTSQSKDKCGCFGSQKGRYNKEHRIRSCVTEVTMEAMEREINRVKARQRIAKQKGYLKYKGSKIQKTSNIPSQQDCQHYSQQKDHLVAMTTGASSLDNTDTVGAIFSRLIGVAEVNQAEVNEVSSYGSNVEKIEGQSMLDEDNKITVGEVTSLVNGEKAKAEYISVELAETDVVAEILDEALVKAFDIAEQEKATLAAEILDEALAKAFDIAEQEKATLVGEVLDEALAKAFDIAEQEKATLAAEILDEALAKAFDIAEQEKATLVGEVLDEALVKVFDIAEQEKATLAGEILDEALAKAFDIAEQEKATLAGEILDEALAKAFDIAEQEKATLAGEILDEALAKAFDIAEQEKATLVADILDEALVKAFDIAEQEKATLVGEILDEALAKALFDIAEQEKATLVADILDEALVKVFDIAEQEKATLVGEILDEALAKVFDIAEQEKATLVGEILDEALVKAFDIAEQDKTAAVREILEEADECRPLDPVNVPSLCTTVAAHEELLKSTEQEDEVFVKAEPLMVPSMSRKGSWVRDSSRQTSEASKQSDVTRTESKASLYKPCQLKEAFKQTKTHEGIRNLQQKVSMSPFRDPLRKELYSGKFTILTSRDHSGCAIAVFVAQVDSPATSHEVVMNNMYIQLNQAVKSPQTQANGIILLYDFSKADYKASDLKLFAKILQVFKTAYPVPLKRTLLISAPFWLEAELQLLGLRVRRQDRIEIVTHSKLKECLPVTCLPEDLGGNNHDDHAQWVEQCLAGYVETFGSDDGQNEWTNESVTLGDVASGMKSDVEEKQDRSSAPPAVIWQAYPKKSGHGSVEDVQSGLKSIAKRKVQTNRERRSAPPNLIWQTSSPEKSGQASLKAVPSELKSESRRKAEETKGRLSASGNLIWQLNP